MVAETDVASELERNLVLIKHYFGLAELSFHAHRCAERKKKHMPPSGATIRRQTQLLLSSDVSQSYPNCRACFCRFPVLQNAAREDKNRKKEQGVSRPERPLSGHPYNAAKVIISRFTERHPIFSCFVIQNSRKTKPHRGNKLTPTPSRHS